MTNLVPQTQTTIVATKMAAFSKMNPGKQKAKLANSKALLKALLFRKTPKQIAAITNTKKHTA